MKLIDSGICTSVVLFEPILLLSLLLLAWLSWSQSERFIRVAFVIAAVGVFLFSIKAWNHSFQHFAVLYGVFSSIGFFFGITRYFSLTQLKYVFAAWFVLLAFGLWFFETLKFIPFCNTHYIRQPLRFSFSGYTVWTVFLVLSSGLVYYLPNRKRSMGVWVGVLFVFVFMLEGGPITLGFKKYDDVLFWGIGPDKENSSGETELYVAVEQKNIKRVRELLSQGADVNKPSKTIGGPTTPFEVAIRSNDYDLFLLVAEKGGDITQVNKGGSLPIHLAAYSWNFDLRIVQYLLDHGADIHARDKLLGLQPIHIAVGGAHFMGHGKLDNHSADMVGFLIENGADIEARTRHGSTPLIVAADYSDFEAVKSLVERGADIHAEGSSGKNALEIARNRRGYIASPIEKNQRYDQIIDYLEPLMEE